MGNSLGLLVPLQYFSLSLCIPSVLFLPACWLLVESPIWLIRRNKKEDAVQALTVLRGENYVMEEEIAELQNIVRSEAEERSKLSAFKSRKFLLPGLLITVSYFIEVLSGIELCCYYVGFIFTNIGVTLEIAAIITQVIFMTW